jgi:hypothetical protein
MVSNRCGSNDTCGACMNNGTCRDNGTCQCPDGFTGNRCQTQEDPCRDVMCMHGGTCENGGCMCVGGWQGNRCQTCPNVPPSACEGKCGMTVENACGNTRMCNACPPPPTTETP